MKRAIILILICIVATITYAQTWSELTDEQKVMKLKTFRAENQAYLKNTLGMNKTQMDDIDNVNACYLTTLDRINRYGKSDTAKNRYAELVSQARWAQLDAIMGKEKNEQYNTYLKAKIEKAVANQK